MTPPPRAPSASWRRPGFGDKTRCCGTLYPGWNGTRKIPKQELADGAAEVRNLMALLRDMEVVVLVGKRAARAEPLLAGTGVAIFHSLHNSPLVRASRPADWARIPEVWAETSRALRPSCWTRPYTD